MIEYQNIFTQVQVRGPAEMGLDNEAGTMAAERMGTPWFSNLAGWIGNAQLGPVYLGWTGMIGLATGLAWFFIVVLACWRRWIGLCQSSSGRVSGWR